MKNGYATKFIAKFIGFKGLTFGIATAGLFMGRLGGYEWITVALSICCIKALEDTIVRVKNNH